MKHSGMDYLKPSLSCPLGSTIDYRGFSNVTQTGELWDDLAKITDSAVANNKNGVDNFLDIWQKVRP